MKLQAHRIPTGSLVEVVTTGVRLFVVRRFYSPRRSESSDEIDRYVPEYVLSHTDNELFLDALPRDNFPQRRQDVYGYGEDDPAIVSLPEHEVSDAERLAFNESFAALRTDRAKNPPPKSDPVMGNKTRVEFAPKGSSDKQELGLLHEFFPFSFFTDLAQPHWRDTTFTFTHFDAQGRVQAIMETDRPQDILKEEPREFDFNG